MTYDYDKAYEDWKWDLPDSFNMGYDCADKHVDAGNGDKIALIYEDEAGNGETYTFAQMKELSDKFGNVLKELGLKKGDRFLIRLPNIPAFQIAFLGGLKIGAIPIPSSCTEKCNEIFLSSSEFDVRPNLAEIVTCPFSVNLRALLPRLINI